MSGDPLGLALRELFFAVLRGPALVPDLLALLALVAGLTAAVALPLPVRPVPSPARPRSPVARAGRALAAAVGLALPGAWDLLAGRAGLGALQALAFAVCYGVARGARGEGLLAAIELPAPSYFGSLPAGVAYLAPAALADTAAVLALLLFAVNIPWTLWRARAAGVFGPPPAPPSREP